MAERDEWKAEAVLGDLVAAVREARKTPGGGVLPPCRCWECDVARGRMVDQHVRSAEVDPRVSRSLWILRGGK